ncbi:MAG: iron-containing alcohol dehydrogenase [Proteobacteria bacterium]|nr:iron-containing alcohol dehydrogenase [Pseudomonadota bacterium]MBU1386624.1 iron-containing alcohol dehydrogenase [Pseudomonadota bacterium]MBU1542368.1 iron-containing alcohol dehydrogenase [Pseudomonadota bacterium]MBU2480518.1 iron-containing alcohol dehydrogenase [Pseudomonadota bacterium]
MLNFNYQNPTRILFGKNQIKNINKHIPTGSKVLITYGGGSIKKNGILDAVKAALAGYDLSEFGGIEPNPSYETLMKCVKQIHDSKVDFILAVGGGSVIDGTKFIAAAVPYEADPSEILSTFGYKIKTALPFGTVLTLPATGSEMNCGSVITIKATHTKIPFSNPAVYPVFSVLDPETTYTLPPKQVSNGVIDTFVHIIEQYLTYPVNAKVQDRFAEGLLLTLIEEGPKALAEPENYDVKANLMWCATLGLNGLIGAGVPQDWATHMIGHEITALHGVDHAQTLAIVLPSLLKTQKESKKEKLLQYADRIWGITQGSDDEKIDQAIEKTEHFFHAMNIKTKLSDYGIAKESIPAIIEQLAAHGMVKLGEKKEITPDVSKQILEMSI